MVGVGARLGVKVAVHVSQAGAVLPHLSSRLVVVVRGRPRRISIYARLLSEIEVAPDDVLYAGWQLAAERIEQALYEAALGFGVATVEVDLGELKVVARPPHRK